MNDAAVAKIQAQMEELKASLTTARKTRDAVQAQIAAVNSAPPTRQQCIAAFMAAMDVQQKLSEEKLEARIANWRNSVPESRPEYLYIGTVLPIMAGDWQDMILPTLWPTLSAAIAAKINAVDWPDHALDPTEKQARLAELEPQAQAAQAAVDALETQAGLLGVR